MAPIGRVSRSQFHRYGPLVLVGIAVAALAAVEFSKHHNFNRIDVVYLCVLVPSIILHEISHGVVALWCGDTTAKDAKRLTLNPFRHIDLFGTIIVPLILVISHGPLFGWAKPVPVDVGRLRHPRNQAVLVGLAGPATNIVLALGAGFILRAVSPSVLLTNVAINQWPLLELVLVLFAQVNVFLAVFNLIPIPPLDGSAVVERLLPSSLVPGYYRIRIYGLLLVFSLRYVDPNLLSSLFDHGFQYWNDIVFA